MPEGFIRRSTLNKRLKMAKKSALDELIQDSFVARAGNLFYDSKRLTREQVYKLDKLYKPTLPHLLRDGHLPQATIEVQMELRDHYLRDEGHQHALAVLDEFRESPGYIALYELVDSEEYKAGVEFLLEQKLLRQVEDLLYDPLRLGHTTMKEVAHKHQLGDQYRQLTEILQSKPGKTAPKDELISRFGHDTLHDLLAMGGFGEFSVPMKISPHKAQWVRLKGSDTQAARDIALEAVKIKDEDWQPALELTGDVLRPGARDGKTLRMQVVARSYTLNRAYKRLGVRQLTLEEAINAGYVQTFVDPEEKVRIPAVIVEQALVDNETGELIAGFEQLKVRDIAMVTGLSYSTIRRRLSRIGVSRTQPMWGDVRGLWGLPETLPEYYEILRIKVAEWRAAKAAEREEQQRLLEEQRQREEEEQRVLRDRLVAAFPAWQHEYRTEQRIFLHVGPPNSGKTHDSLNRLVEAGSGWYLAPLRLLAYEIFDRLNRRGVLCSLLTGEEYIEVPGASITAATIEMFNPNDSGECVVIDEAQLLADADRGWAWTRAMMQSSAPELHMIGPDTSRDLIEQLAEAATIPLEVIEHQRLAPIEIARKNWSLRKLPPHTILVAFSRRMVLQLKAELERTGRTVSVIYGSLPPEVRRKQADRFADGETEICVATDAVGMGLNLPADRVCFYELEKYDGRNVRTLRPAEVQQIGGRAGRYGIRETGEVGTLDPRDLKLLRTLFYAEAERLTHARVAPSVEDLELIPGSLWERLVKWAMLESIPDALRDKVKTADLTSRIELAKMLTDAQVEQLGLANAMQLINAPTRQSSQNYWYGCAMAILDEEPIPHPPEPPEHVHTGRDLEVMESCISCADVYLWLARRREFRRFAPDEPVVRQNRINWSTRIDEALLRKIDTKRRCPSCGRPIPIGHRHRLCDDCYYNGLSSSNYRN